MPKRPEHDDFWRISQAVIDTDTQSEAGQGVSDIAARYVDPESLRYAAQQRAQRLGMNRVIRRNDEAVVAATWMDAFIAGIRFQHLKTTDAQTFDDTEERP